MIDVSMAATFSVLWFYIPIQNCLFYHFLFFIFSCKNVTLNSVAKTSVQYLPLAEAALFFADLIINWGTVLSEFKMAATKFMTSCDITIPDLTNFTIRTKKYISYLKSLAITIHMDVLLTLFCIFWLPHYIYPSTGLDKGEVNKKNPFFMRTMKFLKWFSSS